MSGTPKPSGCGQQALGCGCLTVIGIVILVVIGAVFAPKGASNGSSPTQTTQQDSQQDTATSPPQRAVRPKATPRPTPEPTQESYEHQRQREKREFLDSVDDSITAAQIAGNPNKYVGRNVELHCTVSNVPQQGMINAACGDDDTNIVIEYGDTNSLDQGQAIRVLGTVQEPEEGTNSFGGAMSFPTVKAEFME